ncbi:YicC family protein [Bacillus sp. FJAT-27225]|uniref:YicC/YloC family endoribonuclease n=1 Tax=Bacillus sp. FJAT-27225 TaxID=1743144 RepID=UPI00080C2CA4|nr:YicC/YloC family endoribonuclease [Bacillus sp. FJAT-27225]OCA85502.1 YicC family protein [Bacillus sp. FJAT-27225]
MVVSMTGYGSSRKESGNFAVNVEIKTVNHRFCEYSIRLPRHLMKLEDSIKKTIGRHIERGRVEILVTVEGGDSGEKALQVNWELLDQYFQFASEAGKRYGFDPAEAFKAILAREEIIHIEERESVDDEIGSLIRSAVDEAGTLLKQMRMSEGEALKADLSGNLEHCRALVTELEEYAPKVAEQYRERLAARMEELLGSEVDESRMLMEVAVFADKSDIHEELARLGSHISQFLTILDNGGVIGRKLDFLVQEMNREANTIGSKANDSAIAKRVVDLKSLIEKLKEQVQNIE